MKVMVREVVQLMFVTDANHNKTVTPWLGIRRAERQLERGGLLRLEHSPSPCMIPLYLMVLSILKFDIEFKNLLYCCELNKNIKVIISMLQYLVRRNPKHAFLSTDEKAGIFENIYPTYKCKNKKSR